jgi:hypothetical protein
VYLCFSHHLSRQQPSPALISDVKEFTDSKIPAREHVGQRVRFDLPVELRPSSQAGTGRSTEQKRPLQPNPEPGAELSGQRSLAAKHTIRGKVVSELVADSRKGMSAQSTRVYTRYSPNGKVEATFPSSRLHGQVTADLRGGAARHGGSLRVRDDTPGMVLTVSNRPRSNGGLALSTGCAFVRCWAVLGG